MQSMIRVIPLKMEKSSIAGYIQYKDQWNKAFALTIFVKSSMYTRLLVPCVGPFPPNSTAWWWSTLVRENRVQGGGLVPVTVGDDHSPERGGRSSDQADHFQQTQQSNWSFFNTFLSRHKVPRHSAGYSGGTSLEARVQNT